MYTQGMFGDYAPTETIAPAFNSSEERLRYYTLPMALNYRRPSLQLWTAAKKTFEDIDTRDCFDIHSVAVLPIDSADLGRALSKYKLSMQPSRHPVIWSKIATVIDTEWGSIENLFESVNYDFLKLRELVQITYKKQFPYLSGPKLFNFWCYILGVYCAVDFKNKAHIDIAVDSHIRRASKVLGLISEKEQDSFDANAIANRWRTLLVDSDIAPVDLNVPLWFWSRAGFLGLDNFRQA